MKLLLAATAISFASGTAYYLVETGVCETQVASVADCAAAAIQLGLDDVDVEIHGGGQRKDPAGCFIEKGNLQFNEDMTNTGDCGRNSDDCICVLSRYVLAETNAACENRITTEEQCAEAALALGFAGSVVVDAHAAPNDPPGCYFEGGTVFMNSAQDNSGDCSAEDKCLCTGVGGVPAASPVAAPSTCPSQRTPKVTTSTTSVLVKGVVTATMALEEFS